MIFGMTFILIVPYNIDRIIKFDLSQVTSFVRLSDFYSIATISACGSVVSASTLNCAGKNPSTPVIKLGAIILKVSCVVQDSPFPYTSLFFWFLILGGLPMFNVACFMAYVLAVDPLLFRAKSLPSSYHK